MDRNTSAMDAASRALHYFEFIVLEVALENVCRWVDSPKGFVSLGSRLPCEQLSISRPQLCRTAGMTKAPKTPGTISTSATHLSISGRGAAPADT